MTIGISKERLIEIAKQTHDSDDTNHSVLSLFDYLIDECTELNPWLPIEQAPKDRSVLTWSKPDGHEVAYWSTSVWVDKGGSWIVCENRSDTQILHPTHYQELPGDPERWKF